MRKILSITSKCLLLAMFLFISPMLLFAQEGNKSITFDFTNSKTIENLSTKNITTAATAEGLQLKINPETEGNLVIEGNWDLTDWVYVTYTLKNNGQERVRFDPIISGKKSYSQWSKPLWSIGWLEPGETRVFNSVLLPDYGSRKRNYEQMDEDFPDMRGMPDGISFTRSFDLKLTKKINIEFPRSKETKDLVLVSVKTTKPSKPELYKKNPKAFFPFIDQYGQYKYAEWKGKFYSDQQFNIEIEKETKDLATHKGSLEWNQYGGFKNGPQLKKTGHFRTEKYQGKWWIVDPEGNLFWSSGVNSGANLSVSTPYKGREHFFEWLPKKSDPEYGKFYDGKEYSFGRANLYRKHKTYNPSKYTEKSLERMKSWGLNTFGGWSVETVHQYPKQQRVPYTAYVGTISPKLNEKFPDVFHPEWEENVRKKIKWKASKLHDDPFFFGYFVDNEMHWYEPNSMAQKVLQKPKDTPGKKAYIHFLKEDLKKIEAFNEKANTHFESWTALEQSTKKINVEALENINIAFYEKLCHIYFSTIKKAIDEISPGNLYLGCRWHVDGKHRNQYNVPIGAKYLDIISFNEYANELVEFNYPGKGTFDKPYLISEFNFGALDSGKFYPGLGHASDQRNRGEKYQNFIESGLRDPNCVGAHWFMWGNSTTAGRSVVGENANCGIVSEMDTPYYELIKYMRKVNYNLYTYRLEN